MKTSKNKTQKLKAELEEAKRESSIYKNSSQTIPDPDLQSKLIESQKKIAKLEQQIEKIKNE